MSIDYKKYKKYDQIISDCLVNIYTLSKDDYYMYKQLELCGMIKMKSELPHWIRHYEPKGRFDDILVNGNDMLSGLENGGTI